MSTTANEPERLSVGPEPKQEPTAKKARKPRKLITYHVLVLERGEGGTFWRSLGTAEAPEPDTARIAALAAAGIPTATAIAIPDRFWNPELFSAEQPPPRYVKGTQAHL